mmetsp:Transcript_165/g.610  ORF Transcript_165/g.610 Transcript_165/m.610 type:complete len:207 (+) Transcript_165:91-711(+)
MIVSGSQHLIIPKRILVAVVLVSTSVFGGILMSNRLYARRVESFLAQKHLSVKTQHKQLEKEREEYRDLFTKLTDQLKRPEEPEFKDFQVVAKRLLEGLQTMQDLLEEKEFQLWEKEGLLEYQEERLINTEDLEVDMTNYINLMANALLAKNVSLPDGIKDQPYFDPQLRKARADALLRPGSAAAPPGGFPATARRRQRQRQRLRR